ncbi:MAG TPA: ribosome recycling factor [Acidobacteriota bacterium]|nr:ribosome recycling factor [Acidobacteriota bacterium]HRR26003.1 ribosome recycling factor [Acidobacteriota bacterium]
MIRNVIGDAKRRMEKTVGDLAEQLAGLRTGRASVHLLDHVMVEYYGVPTPISQVATLHAPEPNLITIQPWDMSQMGAIERAILASDLGLNPSNDGKLIRVPIPPLTEERRVSLVKHVRKVAEEHRTAVRNVRRDAKDHLRKMVKEKEISEDEERRALDEIQKLTDEYIEKIDELSRLKEAEILQG